MHIFVVAADGGTPRQVTSGERQFGVGNFVWAPEGDSFILSADLSEGAETFAERELGEVQELRWKSSKDGREVHGWIIKPPGFDASQKYPLILEMHGGPFADYGDVLDMEKQLMAAAG